MARKHENKQKGDRNIISQREKIKGSEKEQTFEMKSRSLKEQLRRFFNFKSDKKKE